MTVVARRAGFDSRATVGLDPPRSVSHNVRPQDGGAAVHYIGATFTPGSHDDCRASWRASQRHHMSPGGLGATNGASDIGYSAGVCSHGIVLAGRGWGVRSAAQGSNDGNNRFLAVQGLIGPGQTPTVEMLEGIAWVVWEWRRLGAGREVRPHKFFRSTSCPGPLERLAAGLHMADISTTEEGGMDLEDRNKSYIVEGDPLEQRDSNSVGHQLARSHQYTHRLLLALLSGDTRYGNLDGIAYPGTEDDPRPTGADDPDRRNASWRYALQRVWRWVYWGANRSVSIEAKVDALTAKVDALSEQLGASRVAEITAADIAPYLAIVAADDEDGAAADVDA